MRLTLRTLLAYLDRTLDTEDDAAIAEKLRHSDFASQLVTRVQACLASDQLSAPSPDSTGTADDPNRIGEYLDSVLSPAQVAEVERICLESDAHLAEVAACHQILTLVLAKPAEISPALRHRIYEMDPTVDLESLATQGVFGETAGVSAAGFSSDDPTTLVGAPAAAAPAIAPVGPNDSGVSDAPTRLKSATLAAGGPVARNLNSRRPGAPGTSRITAADFGPRPIRVMPWLVSLALLAAFLFVAAKAFAPLLSPPPSATDPGVVAVSPPSRETTEPPAVSPSPQPPAAVDPASEPPAANEPASTDLPSVTPSPAPAQPDSPDALPPEPEQVVTPPPPAANPPDLSDVTPPPGSGIVPSDIVPSDGDSADGDREPVLVSSDRGLLLARTSEAGVWEIAKSGDVIASGDDLLSAPSFRDTVTLPGEIEVTLIGPAQLHLQMPPGQPVVLALAYGRFLISGGQLDDQVEIRFDGTHSQLSLPDPASVVAIEVVATRPPGADPEVPGASQRVLHALATQGAPRWQTGNRPEVTLVSGQRLTVDPSHQVAINDVTQTPDWIDPPTESPGSITELARSGLLPLLTAQPTVELSLREAVGSRRAEIAALAAQTLAWLDGFDVYFGANGIFNQPRQRTYWGEHFEMLVQAADSGPTTAAAIREAIEQMDGAQAALIYRMLWLFSDQQLAVGGDELLVRSLDDSNMTVRVLASENLRLITGSLNNYRADFELASRRASEIRRWEIKARKGEIRWQRP